MSYESSVFVMDQKLSDSEAGPESVSSTIEKLVVN